MRIFLIGTKHLAMIAWSEWEAVTVIGAWVFSFEVPWVAESLVDPVEGWARIDWVLNSVAIWKSPWCLIWVDIVVGWVSEPCVEWSISDFDVLSPCGCDLSEVVVGVEQDFSLWADLVVDPSVDEEFYFNRDIVEWLELVQDVEWEAWSVLYFPIPWEVRLNLESVLLRDVVSCWVTSNIWDKISSVINIPIKCKGDEEIRVCISNKILWSSVEHIVDFLCYVGNSLRGFDSISIDRYKTEEGSNCVFHLN